MKERIGRFRIYIDRAKWYVATLQASMIAVVFLDSIGVELNTIETVILFLVTPVLYIVVGYVDVKLGFLKSEQRKYNQENEAMQEILRKVDEINSKT